MWSNVHLKKKFEGLILKYEYDFIWQGIWVVK